jgi:hypothetical protein
MNKRILALILAGIILCSSAACSGGTENAAEDTETTADTVAADAQAETETEEPDNMTPTEARQLISDELPEKSFDGSTFTVAVESSKTFEIVSEELTGEATSDSVYDRNIRIEDRFDVKIEALETSSPQDNLKTVVTAGASAYQVAGFWNYVSYVPIMAKVVYNWCDIPYINLDQPWYNKVSNDAATINGKLYAINGDLSITTLLYTYGMFFNYSIMDRYGYTGDDLYNMVFDGTWTVDNMHSITTNIYEDTNGDGMHDRDDVHGYSVFLGLNTSDVWLAAFDLDVIDVHDDGTFEITFLNEKTVSALEKAIALTYDANGTYCNTTDWRDVPRAFGEGKIAMTQLYFGETTESLSEMEDKYGILPLPKFDEAQTNYYTNAWDQFSVYAIPKTITAEEKELLGVIFEVLNAESYKTVYPAYYDQALKSRYSAEATTAEIIDIIMEGRKLEFAFQFGEQTAQLPYKFRQLLQQNKTDLASTFKTIEKTATKTFQKVLDVYYSDDE